ncbi:hypothetical protein GIB67_011022 [Kingdonia uniflora]|uniref:Trafficking protein particle complex II-specific subunit 130 homolog n=1 Tax=Kingdonia uniflora TaxID=39325 RepID=A0A7J7L6G1_9MAGN|nr:hypothetical protein GIB67_011022 [Kingdonia uniflora]
MQKVYHVEDVSNLWHVVKSGFEERLPFKRACLNNKTRNLLISYTQFLLENPALASFPYFTYNKEIDKIGVLSNGMRELIVLKAWALYYSKCCKLDLHGPDSNFWDDLNSKIMESIRNTLDRRVQFYEDKIRKLSEQLFMPVWNFCNFFILKESLAFMFEMAHLHEDALREYDELELCYLEAGILINFISLTAVIIQAKSSSGVVQELFLIWLYSIISSEFLAEYITFCMREVWVITVCLTLIDATGTCCNDGILAPDDEKEFSRLQGDLYSLSRVKMILQSNPRTKHFGIQRKPLPLEPSVLLREANRRRASISAGNMFEMFDSRPSFTDGLVIGKWQKKYLELTKGAADNYHHSWWKRHGAVLDGEIAAVYYRHRNYDLAAKSYEKERQAFQLEVVRLAHSEMKHPVPLDVSSLITFSGNPGPPLELCDRDPGILSVTVWSSFPDDITLDSLSFTLIATYSADEGVKAITSSTASIIKPGRNTIMLKVILHSQVKATLTIYDAWLDLQSGFDHIGKGNGRPTPSFFPLVISPFSRAGILFGISIGSGTTGDEVEELHKGSILNIIYGITGDRTIGAHTPVVMESTTSEVKEQEFLFRSSLVLQRPVLDPCLAVGFLPLPSGGIRVGHLVSMRWRVERLKDFDKNISSPDNDEVLYEVDANQENWMIAGRKRGHVSLSIMQGLNYPLIGSRIVISVICVPLVSGYVRPPELKVPNIGEANISCNPTGPHLKSPHSTFPQGLSQLKALQTLLIGECKSLACISEELHHHLTSLRKLHIWRCPILEARCEKDVGEDWSIISHILNIYIYGRKWDELSVSDDLQPAIVRPSGFVPLRGLWLPSAFGCPSGLGYSVVTDP